MATARRLIFFWNFSRHPLLIWLLFFSPLQNSEGDGDSDSGDSFADPCQFLSFPKTQVQLSASLRPLAKNLQKQKLLLGSMWRKSKQKNWKKQGCGSVFIFSGSGSSGSGWRSIRIRIRIQYGSRALLTKNWKKIRAENFLKFFFDQKLQFTYP